MKVISNYCISFFSVHFHSILIVLFFGRTGLWKMEEEEHKEPKLVLISFVVGINNDSQAGGAKYFMRRYFFRLYVSRKNPEIGSVYRYYRNKRRRVP